MNTALIYSVQLYGLRPYAGLRPLLLNQLSHQLLNLSPLSNQRMPLYATAVFSTVAESEMAAGKSEKCSVSMLLGLTAVTCTTPMVRSKNPPSQ